MSEAPKRIWAKVHGARQRIGATPGSYLIGGFQDTPDIGATPYILEAHHTAEVSRLEAEVVRLREVLTWLDTTIDSHCTPTGKPARISDESGVWHEGPAAEICQKVLRALQRLARAALSGEGGKG